MWTCIEWLCAGLRAAPAVDGLRGTPTYAGRLRADSRTRDSLALAGNRLQALPPEMAACARLELLRLSANRLTELPAWLLALPRLSWLAYAGNPFCAQREAETLTQTPIPAIPWPALRPGPVLGQGASGVIYRADYLAGAQPSPVALKLLLFPPFDVIMFTLNVRGPAQREGRRACLPPLPRIA